ncbi:hypothetical protein PMNALOAF_3798 [Methylobacterium adhaesivum]|uniref:Uncharacterized protein n=1 Tax=Methylobacterium adhaesivum TaxID=333297 RepID=A0ABT8BL32_9HYPH|nr:hypothetical protein [Methylobacterium adhaesivum]MDN3592222.1 hypothetical protein [Methylobacterium adhaesivum]GJD32522.1 hypothetical protein PMNALOAF_3798 [Methylobacterium adhaesivum]
MPTLQIHDLVPHSRAVVDPCTVIPLLGERAVRATWQLTGVARYDEALMIAGDDAAERLECLARSSDRIPGALLTDLLSQVAQVIWGEFIAHEAGRDTPWVIIRAIDSSWCEVETDDAGVLDRVRKTFTNVRMDP